MNDSRATSHRTTIPTPVLAPGQPVTMLVPDRLARPLSVVLQGTFGSTYLQWLLRRYRHKFVTQASSNQSRARTGYQAKGQGLTKVRFRVNDGDWAVLSSLALGAGVSRCVVFTWLLDQDFGDVTVPTEQTQPFQAVYIVAMLAVLPDPSRFTRTLAFRQTPLGRPWAKRAVRFAPDPDDAP